MATEYTVDLWGSDPSEDNDDCWTGENFSTLEEAQACYHNPAETFSIEDLRHTAVLVLDGPDVHSERPCELYRPRKRRDEDAEWRHEIAMEAGMLHGCEAYNETMGWDCCPAEED
jgi:hypothetical protein